ncbi:preprotein translocase subunit SecG [Moraxella sp. FZLJ2107]|uniref:preprotein translocase subunit SecG n=1 Tax=unclassified Moraxella TaxID=2685852 RepID=UPI0020C8880A|nr:MULTISPECIES: preprotein translocase subunit SecG [unclassified Moraxella]UTO04544.1 preprotein translocase subunit SecG [Moraxella sp. FZLJ2107]UTO23377.1 preprotein translocase subunit SecG [Moraxella sp. FZLJ2109]
MLFNILLAVHIIVAIVMIGFILIQHGKGADAGASFGAGASGTVFGAAGSANFLTRTTAVLATIFFITSLALAHFAQKQAADQLRLDVPAVSSTPAPTSTTPAQGNN